MPEGFCEQCQGKCCTEFTVYITHYDIKRLLDFTKWDPESFVMAYADDGKCTYPTVKMQEYDVRLGLTHGNKRCVFMKTVDEKNICTVQAYKPMVCRTYPFSVTQEGKLVHVEPYKCPGPVWPGSKEEEEKTIREVRQLHKEYDQYEALVKRWNSLTKERRTGLMAFLDFLIADGQLRD